MQNSYENSTTSKKAVLRTSTPRNGATLAILNSHTDTVKYLTNVWDKNTINKIESAYVLYMNRRNELIECQLLNTGDRDSCLIDIEQILRKAILHGASQIIMAHNHPSGGTEPSDNDKNCTEKLIKACAVLGIDFKDHIIVTPGGMPFSFDRSGLIDQIEDKIKLVEDVMVPGSYANIAFKIADKYCRSIAGHTTQQAAANHTIQALDKLYVKFFDPII